MMRPLIALLIALCVLVSGCELIADFDRGKIPLEGVDAGPDGGGGDGDGDGDDDAGAEPTDGGAGDDDAGDA
jgi:hypothetical protein